MDEPGGRIVILKRRREDGVFDSCIGVQGFSLEIVVYCPEVGSLVTIAWPLASNGRKITAAGLRKWLRSHGLYWSCFCGLLAPSGVAYSCQIVHATDKSVYAFCHSEPSVCGFFMNLTHLEETSTHVSSYPLLPPAPAAIVSPDVRAQFHLHVARMNGLNPAPLFRGYPGSRVHGVIQMAGQSTTRMNWARTRIRKFKRRAMSIDVLENPPLLLSEPTAGPSNLNEPVEDIAPINKALEDQKEILDRLSEGRGIRKSEWTSLVEQCDECGLYFLSEHTKPHMQACFVNIL